MSNSQCETCGLPLHRDECPDPNCRVADLENRIAALEADKAALEEAVREADGILYSLVQVIPPFALHQLPVVYAWRARPAVAEALKGGDDASE